MSRPLRAECADAIYHVTSRGNQRNVIVADDADRSHWQTMLARVVQGRGWRLFAYALRWRRTWPGSTRRRRSARWPRRWAIGGPAASAGPAGASNRPRPDPPWPGTSARSVGPWTLITNQDLTPVVSDPGRFRGLGQSPSDIRQDPTRPGSVGLPDSRLSA